MEPTISRQFSSPADSRYLYCRYEENCQTLMSHKMVEEKRPICKLETMKSQKVMRCKLGMKKMKKVFPKLECRKVAVGKEEKCVEMVKLHEEKQEVKKCSFHPKTICRPVEGLGCRRGRRTMCNYIDTNQVWVWRVRPVITVHKFSCSFPFCIQTWKLRKHWK